MEIIFLGTSSLQTVENFCTSFLVKADEEMLLFEVGPGIVGQLLKLNVSYSQINGIFISHAHFDHFIDFPYLLYLGFTEQFRKGLSPLKIPLISTSQVFELTSYIFENCYPKIPFQKLVEFLEASISKFSSFRIGKFEITTAPVKHTLPTVGCKIKVDGKILVYSGDTVYSDNLIRLAEGADILIHEAITSSSYPLLEQVAKTGLHGTAYEAGEVANEAKVKKLVLVHSDQMVKKEDLIFDARKNFRGEIFVPKEFERITV